MSQYLQTSTANPYGHRPWATRLYTGFENYSFLKQPQNTIIREDVNMRPEIYRPPEMKPAAALGDMTIVGGSGRILRRARARRRGTLGLLPAMQDFYGARSNIVMRGPMTYTPPGSVPPPIRILPPPIVPPVPQIVYAGPGGNVYALPGNASTPGSPFAPAPASELPLPAGAIQLTTPAAAAAATDAAATPAPTSSFSAWFNSQDYIAGVANGYVAIGGALAVYLFTKKKR